MSNTKVDFIRMSNTLDVQLLNGLFTAKILITTNTYFQEKVVTECVDWEILDEKYNGEKIANMRKFYEFNNSMGLDLHDSMEDIVHLECLNLYSKIEKTLKHFHPKF